MVPYVAYCISDRFAFHREKRKEIDEVRKLAKEEELKKKLEGMKE